MIYLLGMSIHERNDEPIGEVNIETYVAEALRDHIYPHTYHQATLAADEGRIPKFCFHAYKGELNKFVDSLQQGMHTDQEASKQKGLLSFSRGTFLTKARLFHDPNAFIFSFGEFLSDRFAQAIQAWRTLPVETSSNETSLAVLSSLQTAEDAVRAFTVVHASLIPPRSPSPIRPPRAS